MTIDAYERLWSIILHIHTDKELTKLSVQSVSWSGLSLQRYKSFNTSENTCNINTYKRTANAMYNPGYTGTNVKLSQFD